MRRTHNSVLRSLRILYVHVIVSGRVQHAARINSFVADVLQKKAKLEEVFSVVCERLGLRETEFFGLARLAGQ